MENKVLIKLLVPEIEQSFDVFIPINEIVWKIKRMLVKSVGDLSGIILDIKEEYFLINEDSGRIYGNNEIIYDTDIKNSTELLLTKKM